MKKSIAKKVLMLSTIVMIGLSLTGCMREFDKPEIVEILASQTAFLIPYDGDTTKQAKFQSEDFLAKNLVPGKQVSIPHKWLQEGRMKNTGRYIKSANLIVVERKPVTRNWTSDTKTGTTKKDEGFHAETKESIAFIASMNAIAQIDETNTAKFLYRYNSSTLETIMDGEIRSRISSKFIEECAKYELSDLLLNKDKVMDIVRKDVTPYFKERGITINTIGMSSDFTYVNVEIQKAIDDKFKSKMANETQKTENERVLSKAVADAKAIKMQGETILQSLKLKQLENETKAIEKWDGKMPQYSGSATPIFNIPTGK